MERGGWVCALSGVRRVMRSIVKSHGAHGGGKRVARARGKCGVKSMHVWLCGHVQWGYLLCWPLLSSALLATHDDVRAQNLIQSRGHFPIHACFPLYMKAP